MDPNSPVDAEIQVVQELLVQGRATEALQLARRELERFPNFVPLYELLGSAHMQLGDFDSAAEVCRKSLELQPDSAKVLALLAQAYEAQGRFNEAINCLREALALRPNIASLHNNLGALLARLRQPAAAATSFKQALALAPNHAGALANYGWLCFQQGDRQAGQQMLERAVSLQPAHPLARYNLACVLNELNALTEAERHFRAAIQAAPNFSQAWHNLGGILAETGREPEAIHAFENAIAAEPSYADARTNLAWLLLAQGDYARGLELYEARRESSLAGNSQPPPVGFPEWRGEDLGGKSLLIWPEMSFGDEIVMVRFVATLRERGAAHLTLVCKQPLLPLFGSMPGVDELISLEDARTRAFAHDYWVLQASLPHRLGVRLAMVPSPIPYLIPDRTRLEYWRHQLPAAPIRVGLIWKGSGSMRNDPRSIKHLNELEPLWAVEGVSFVSLQKGEGEDEAINPPASQPLTHLGSEIRDFADTAAIIAQLDLIISVDTAAVHVAASLGKPCWVLVPAARAFWIWGRGADTTPWYAPSLRLFRQARGEPWGRCLLRVKDSLVAFSLEKRGSEIVG